MRVLLLGSGGRENALASGLAHAPSVTELLAAPGNPGIAGLAETRPLSIAGPKEVVGCAREVEADLVVIGPEAPLVVGVGDALREAGIAVFGPSRDAARIEGSKTHAKQLMRAAGVPTAEAVVFTSVEEALKHLEISTPPYVIKADGLAAGKGVVVTEAIDDARDAVRDSLERGRFGEAGSKVLLEEFLDGEEASLIAFTDGTEVVACEPAQDYKRVDDGDRGPNTGGMGSYSPVPACPPALADKIVEEVIRPMVRATASRGAPFVGALYAGLALTSEGPRVIEFNARFGDPETQALIPRLESDLGEVCMAAASGELRGTSLSWSRKACVSVVLAAGGYPGEHATGHPITGVEDASSTPDVEVFHAGTRLRDGELVTSGGRVLAVSALGEGFADARTRAYRAAEMIDFEGKHVRSDIALRAEEAEKSHPVKEVG